MGAIELHHCQGLQRHKELSNNNKGTMARKEGSKGGKRAELSHCGHPTIPWSRGGHSISTCCSEQAAGLRGEGTLYSYVRIVSPLKLTHSTTKMTVFSPSNCYLTVSARLSPKDRMKAVTEKSHTPFYPSSTLEIKTEYATAFQKSY